MTKTRSVCAAFLSVCCAAFSAEATGIVATYDPVTQKVTMVDTTNGATLVTPVGAMKVCDTSWDFLAGETPLMPATINFTANPDGYDIEFVFINTTSTPQRVGTLWVGTMPFGSTTYYRDTNYFLQGDNEGTATWNSVGHWHPGGTVYPGGCYSPVHVARGYVTVPPVSIGGGGVIPEGTGAPGGMGKSGGLGEGDGFQTKDKTGVPDDKEIPVEPAMAEYAIGISLQYPVLDYDVSVFKGYQAVDGYWRFGFHINPLHIASDSYNAAGNIPPYDSAHPDANKRTYKYSVRVLRNPSSYPVLPAEWLRTLEPYRKYFQKTYGAPRYTPDYRPIEGIGLSQGEFYDPVTNPFAFHVTRPDTNGWGPTVDDLEAQRLLGWPRQVLWSPSGQSAAGLNYRYEFTSHWKPISPMAATQYLLTDYSFRLGGIGLWWGRSTEVMNDWNSATETIMDQRDAALRKRAFEELDGARAVGAREIGLDQYALQRRAGFAWLQEMRIRYPEMRFCGEAVQSDIIHLQAANFERIGDWPQETDHSACSPARPLIRPLAMADFLLHKHETWGAGNVMPINENECNGLGWVLNTPAMNYWPEYVASQGYTPLINLVPTADQVVNTAAATGSPSYPFSVPSDLQTPYCPQITAQPPVKLAGVCSLATTLSATAVSPRGLTLSYQWYYRPESLDPTYDTLPADLVKGMMAPCTDPSYWANSNTSTLTIYMAQKAFGTYALLVTEPDGGPTWTAYTRVYSMADFDRNGAITPDDLSDFITSFYFPYQDVRADVNNDGVIDSSDYSDFLDAFFMGC